MKIVGNTVSTTLPKPSFDQTDPNKGDYILGDRSFTKGDKGDKGDPGADGKDGYTPVKGTDYYTEEEKQEMVASVLAAIPQAVSVHTKQEGDTYTMTVTLDDGSSSTSVITVENGLPVKLVTDGVELPLTWEAVDTGEETQETVLFGQGSTAVWVNRGTGAAVTEAVLSGTSPSHGAFGEYFHTQSKIDLTAYSKLKVHVTAAATGSSCLAVMEALSDSYTGMDKYQTFAAAGTAELDVADCAGEYYVAVIAGGDAAGASFTADKVWLE